MWINLKALRFRYSSDDRLILGPYEISAVADAMHKSENYDFTNIDSAPKTPVDYISLLLFSNR